MKNIPKLQKRRAAELRSHLTEAEVRLWRHLRMRQLGGRKFSRQIPVGPFIADFVCRELMVIAEVDGGQHGNARDVARRRYLEAEGYLVLRFWNNEVLANTEAVLGAIGCALLNRPPPAPPVPGGEQKPA